MTKAKSRPRLVSVVALEARDEAVVLGLAASLAAGLASSFATAILESARERALPIRPVERFHKTTHTGVAGSVDGKAVALGDSAFFKDLGLSVENFGEWPARLQQRGEQVMFVAVDANTAGLFGVVEEDLKGNESDHNMEVTMQALHSSSKQFPTETLNLPMVHSPETFELADGDQFDLRIAPAIKQFGGKIVRMLAYNGSIPGPTLRVRQGSDVVVNVVNEGDVHATVHWHGLRLANRYDGTTLTQRSIPVGGTFTYRLTFPDPGIYWYHPHIREDYGQELGLYGNIIVVPSESNYWPAVNRELTLTLDDILLEDGKVAPFDPKRPTYTAMGRFGNILLVNGQPEFSLRANPGEVVRFYLTNTANTRVFNVGIRGARMKLVGGDSGRYEQERFVDTVVIAPSERVVVDVLFDQAGRVELEHRTPNRTYRLGTITIGEQSVKLPLSAQFGELRTSSELTDERSRLESYLTADPDKTLALVAEMDMGEPQLAPEMVAYVCPMHPDVTSAHADRCPKCGMKLVPAQLAGAVGHSHHDHAHDPANEGNTHEAVAEHVDYPEGIEWEDDMVEVNRLTNPTNMRWKLIDRLTGAEGTAIDWRFRVGDRVKIRVVNEMDSDHPMHHPFHIHGAGRFLILSRDGVVEPNLVWKDTVLIPTGQTVEILFDVTHPGVWMAHCHIAEHHESGMMLRFHVEL